MGVLLDDVHFPSGPAVFDSYVLAVCPAQPLETLTERGDARLTVGIAFRNCHEDTDRACATGLLRAGDERQCDGRTAKRGHKLPPSDADCHLTCRN